MATDNDITGIIIASIPGLLAIVLALIAIYERRQDKKSEKIRKEKESEIETIKEHSANAIKEIADEISAQWQQRVDVLETQVKELKASVDSLQKELNDAYIEIDRLKKARRKL